MRISKAYLFSVLSPWSNEVTGEISGSNSKWSAAHCTVLLYITVVSYSGRIHLIDMVYTSVVYSLYVYIYI